MSLFVKIANVIRNIRTMNLMSERNSEYGAKSEGGVIWSGNYKIR